MALALGEVLWAAGDFAVDAYFTGDLLQPLWRAAGRYVKRKIQRAAFDAIYDSVFPSNDSNNKEQAADQPRTTDGDASRRNGRLGGRPPYKNRPGSARTRGYTGRKRPYDEMSVPPVNSDHASGSGMQSDQPSGGSNDVVMGTSNVLCASGGLREPHTVTIIKQRTFKHYLLYDAHNDWVYSDIPADAKDLYGEKAYVNKDWKYLPYNWFHVYMSQRDYQALNVEYKRWRVKSFGVSAHHIVPFVDDIRAVSGNVSPAVEISPLNFFEAFCDKLGELPHMRAMLKDLPNDKMQTPYMPRTKSTLQPVPMVYNGYRGGEGDWFISLEQSPSYQFVHAEDGFSYEHKVHPVDQQWRHALFPMNQNYTQYKSNYDVKDQYFTPILGKVNNLSGTLMAKNSAPKSKAVVPGVPGDNLMYDSWQAHFPHSPPPKILLRVPEIQRASDSGCPYGFLMFVTYRMVIEAEPNYIVQAPIAFSNPKPNSLFANEREMYQATGGDSHKMIHFGDKKNQMVGDNNEEQDVN